MRRISKVINEYDPSEKTDSKKITIIEWFQKHPGKRFDSVEVYQEIGEELEVGEGRVSQYLKSLNEEGVLEKHGKKRISYWLADDIIIPVKYQAKAALRHLATIFDIKRWGVAGFMVISTALWGLLTLPFLFFSIIMALKPTNQIGPISAYEMHIFTLGMVLWLVVFVIISYAIFRASRWL